MTTATATEVKNRFGEFLEKARREPVRVQKSGRNCVVILDNDEYERLQAEADRYWVELAKAAEKRGKWIGHEEAMDFLLTRMAEIEAEEKEK